jgi:hypothetical protein
MGLIEDNAYIQIRKCLHEIAGEVGIVMAYVNLTTQMKLSGDIKEMRENSVSSLSKIREEINKMRDCGQKSGNIFRC